jgi:hypothetical protein
MVHSACVFYYYSKLTGAKPEDWKEFCLWLNTLAMHRINMRFGIEKQSAKGFWSMCRKIAEIYDYKQGKARFPWSGGALIILKEDLQKRGF